MSAKAGFTLIELAVVIVIVGIIISIIASVLPSLIASSKIKQAQALLEKADNTLQGYSLANHRLPFADSGTDGIEDTGVFVGNLPYRTLGLSSGEDVWGHSIRYAVYGKAAGANNLTQGFPDAAAFCAAISAAATTPFDISIAHTTIADPCSGADATNASNQAYVLISSGLKDLDGVNGLLDDCNGQAGAGFNIPGKIQTTTYDDLVRAFALNELNQKNCAGSGAGAGGGGGESAFAGGCSNTIDDDGDGLVDCADSDCSSDPSCTGSLPLSITTTSVPSGPITGTYMTAVAATGGTTPYQWSLTDNGGFSDFVINPFTGLVSGTLSQCPGTYSIAAQVQDATSGTPQTDSRSYSLQVTPALTVSRTSGAGIDITWSAAAQQETFQASGGRLDTINWSLNSGGASGFTVSASGPDTGVISKTGTTTPGTYTFTLTATDAACPANTDDLILNVTVTAAGAGAPGAISGVVDTLVLDNNAGYNPDIIHISGDIYAVAYTGQGNDGYIRTVQIAADGQIGNTVIDALDFENQSATDPDFIHVTGDIYAVAYTDRNGYGHLATVQIDSAGQITNSTIDELIFDSSYCYEPDIIQVSSNVFAIAYTGPGNDGYVTTVQIDSSGQITNAVIDTLDFDTSRGREVDLLSLGNDIFAVAYQGAGRDGFVATLSIDSSGQIANSPIDRLEFDTSNCYNPGLVQVSSDIYAIAYTGPGNDGFIKSIQIDSSGQITNSVIDTLEFDTSNGLEPVITSVGSGIFAIAYRGVGDDGFFRTVQVDAAGQIGNAVVDSLEFDTSSGIEPSMVAVTSNVFAIAYRGQGNRAYITTIALQ